MNYIMVWIKSIDGNRDYIDECLHMKYFFMEPMVGGADQELNPEIKAIIYDIIQGRL